jgi:hypothetical protein
MSLLRSILISRNIGLNVLKSHPEMTRCLSSTSAFDVVPSRRLDSRTSLLFPDSRWPGASCRGYAKQVKGGKKGKGKKTLDDILDELVRIYFFLFSDIMLCCPSPTSSLTLFLGLWRRRRRRRRYEEVAWSDSRPRRRVSRTDTGGKIHPEVWKSREKRSSQGQE